MSLIRKTDRGCRCSKTDGWSEFNWRMAKDDRDSEMHLATRILVPEMKLRVGAEYRCSNCRARFYLDSQQLMMASIASHEEVLFDRWANAPLVPSEEMLKTLASIKEVPTDLYGNGADKIDFPCRCTTKDGQEIDFCIVRFCETPLDVYAKRVLLLSEIVSVSPSEFTLPPKVILASTRLDEIGMGYSPGYLHSPDGKVFAINGTTVFFSFAPWKGKDMAMLEEPSKEDMLVHYQHTSVDLTVVIGDPSDVLAKSGPADSSVLQKMFAPFKLVSKQMFGGKS